MFNVVIDYVITFRRTVQSDRAFVEALVVEEVGAAGAVDSPSVWQTPVAPR